MFTKKRIIIASILTVAIGLSGLGFYYLVKATPPKIETTTVKRGNIIQEVSVTGIVKPAESVELGFEKSGKIASKTVKVGDIVKKNQLLVTLQSGSSSSSVSQSLASLASARATKEQYQAVLLSSQAKLNEMKLGTRNEEIIIAETTVSNAKLSVTDAENALADVKLKADTDLNTAYDTAISSANNSVGVSLNTLYTITDIQTAHFTGYAANATLISDKKDVAVLELLGTANAGEWWNSQLSGLNGGAKKMVADALVSQNKTSIDAAMVAIQSSLQKMRDLVYAVPVLPELTATEITSLTSAKNNINYEITVINSKIQAIQTQKITNNNAITTSQNSLTTAQNNLRAAETQLLLKKAGYTREQLQAQEAVVQQAEANVKAQDAQIRYAQSSLQSSSSELAKNFLRSPINGVVTEVSAKVGEIAPMNTTIVKIMSAAKFEIEANVPEADIAKIKLNDTAELDLDAYGSDEIFNATVTKIDPAEKILDGVPTYKVTLQFDQEDVRIKSGMTANMDISTARAENVLYIPKRAVISENGKKFVQQIKNLKNGEFDKIEVETGISGSNGEIEIKNGLNENQEIVVYIEK